MKIYGPYTRKDGRKHIVIVHDDGSKQTKSYPRHLMEQHLGRPLDPSEVVDHINNDFTDDRIENLQILTASENSKKEMARPQRAKEYYSFICPCCGNEAVKPMNFIHANKKKGKSDPYCSHKCAGKFTSPKPDLFD